MENLVKRAGLAILGVVVTLAYWSFFGGSVADSEVEGIPSIVWEGGGGTLSVETDTTTPAKFRISFNGRGDDDKSLAAWTPVTPGAHIWTINIPRGAGGYIELSADDPKVGDKLSWRITLNGETVDEQLETLEQPLSPGYGFFLQSYYDDYSTIGVQQAEQSSVLLSH
jgi:hypothetical protein